MTRKETLDKAAECVLKDRQVTHGPPENSFADIAAFWSAYLNIKIAPYQVAMMMTLLKVARSKTSPMHEDHYVDAAGYSAIAAELATPSPLPSFWNESPSHRPADCLPAHLRASCDC